MERIRIALIALALGGATFGALACNRSADEAHNDAVEAQNQANRQIQQAQTEANKDVNQAQTEAQKDIDKARQEEQQKTAEAQAKANEKIREANTDMKDANADLRVWGQKRVDELSNTIDKATVKAEKAPPAARASFESGIKEVRSERDEISAEIGSLDRQVVRDTNSFRERIDNRVDQLKDRVSKLEDKL
jgi:peptidoglycan hydrolase CwlO-like protein